jgi:DNA-binding SARP family transcriptional activator
MADQAAKPLRVRLLGSVQARRGATDLDLGTAHRRAVFAVLAMRANYTVSREELIDAVWGEAAPVSAAGGVYTYVSALRHVLDPDRALLTSGSGGYCLHLPDEHVDVPMFERLRDTARRLRAGGDAIGERGALRAALDLWHGPAFAGVPGPFAHNQRVRLGELRLATVERHATLALDAGAHDDALGELGPLAAENPVRESLHALLMDALYRAGRPAEAAAAYRRLHDTLVEASGTEPSSVLRQLYDRVRHTGPEPVRRIPRQRIAVSAPGSTFVGRTAELGRLRDALDALRDGRGGSFWLEGEPGSGKSALLTAALHGLDGITLGRGVGDELAQRLPLSALLECLDLPPGRPELRAAVDGFRATAAELGAPGLPTVLQHAGELVRRLCADGPLVLVLDDLQWADDASLLAWRHLHRLTRHHPVLLIGAARPVPRRREVELLRGALRAAGAAVVTLPALTDAESAALVRAAAPGRTGPALPGIAADLAAGNPRYLHAVVRAAVRGDLLPLGRRPVSRLSPLLVEAVDGHLDLLAPDTLGLLRAAAFLGDGCTVAELAAITVQPVGDLVAAVEEALAAGVLADGGGARLRFRHPLVRRVLHDGTPTALRLTLHRDFAEKLAAGLGAPERVAELLVAGPVPLDDWAHRWLDEHLGLLQRRDPDAAVDLLRYATAEPTLPPARRIELTARLARLLLRDSRPAELDAGWVAAHTTDRTLIAEMRWILAVSQHRRGNHSAATGIVRTALHDPATPSKWRGRFAALLTRVGPHLPHSPHRLRARRRAVARNSSANRHGRTRRHGTLVTTGPG